MKEKENGEKKGTLAGARTRALKFKVAPKLFGPAVRYVFFGENNIALYTGHARVTHGIRHAARPNMDHDVYNPNPSLHRQPRVVSSRAVSKEICMSKNRQHFEQ